MEKKSCSSSFLTSLLCCSEMSTKWMCYTRLFYCHILLRLQSKHQFLPAQFRVVPNDPLHAQVLCTHDHFCEHLMLLPTWMLFILNAMGTASKLLPIFIHFQRFFSQGRMCWTNLVFFAQSFVSRKSSLFVECRFIYVYKKTLGFSLCCLKFGSVCLPLSIWVIFSMLQIVYILGATYNARSIWKLSFVSVWL